MAAPRFHPPLEGGSKSASAEPREGARRFRGGVHPTSDPSPKNPSPALRLSRDFSTLPQGEGGKTKRPAESHRAFAFQASCRSDRVVHLELDRVRGVLEGVDLAHLELDIA